MTPPGIAIQDVASIAEIRARFPALGRIHGGQPVAYLDGPGGTQVPRVVVEAMADYLYHHNANTHWAFPTSRETDEVISQGRQAVADFLNADPGEIAFGNNMTSLTFHLARSLGRRMGPGDEVVVTELDHHANVDPWRAMASERGVTVRVAKLRPEDGQLDWDDLERQVSDNTRVLAIGAGSNALGTISDIPRASKLARDHGTLLFVDAVHYAPHRLVDVQALGCDFLACSAYKFYGPHTGILFGRAELLASLDVPKLRPSPDMAPERLETGTQNHEGIAGTAAAIDFLAGLAKGPDRRSRLTAAFDALHHRASRQVSRLWDGLESIGGVTLYGPRPDRPRTPTISFSLEGWMPGDVCSRLAEHGIFASHGDFYATTAVERLGRSSTGLVRLGCACYTSDEEIDRLLDAIQRLARL
jgi:cysteine desulfurase family protein (TIGR01976 family)